MIVVSLWPLSVNGVVLYALTRTAVFTLSTGKVEVKKNL